MRQEEKKKFEKQTAKFVQSQERHLNLSTKKQDSVLQEVSYLFFLLPSLHLLLRVPGESLRGVDIGSG
jgi:hypothetical protein